MRRDSYHILTLPLETQIWQEDILEKRYAVAENIYNSILRRAYVRYRQMCQTRFYRDLRQRLTEASDAKVQKEIYQSFDQLAKQYRLGKFELSRDATPYRQYFKENIDSPVNQNLAANVWKAIWTVMIGRGRKVAYKKPGELLSLSGKTNRTSIRYRDGSIIWKGLVMPVRFHKNSQYEADVMKNPIRLCRLKRRKIKRNWHYYVDLIFEGTAPVKPGSKIQKSGKVGVEIGERQLIAATNSEVKIFDLSASYEHYRKQMSELKSYMYRSAYHMNPNNFDSNGNVRHGNRKWHYSKKYQKAKERRKELYRKLTAVRKQDYCVLSHKIIQMGDRILIRDFSSYKEHKKSILDSKKKVNYFYSGRLPTFAPKALLHLLQYKVKNAGGNTYCFDIQKLRKGAKEQNLCERLDPNSWEVIQGYQIRQDVYHAFLLSHTDIHNETVNQTECQDNFHTFLQLCQNYQMNLDETLHILKLS